MNDTITLTVIADVCHNSRYHQGRRQGRM